MTSWLDIARRRLAARWDASRAPAETSGPAGRPDDPNTDGSQTGDPQTGESRTGESQPDGSQTGDQARGTQATQATRPAPPGEDPPGESPAGGGTSPTTSGSGKVAAPAPPAASTPPSLPEPSEPPPPASLAPSLAQVGMFTWMRVGFLVALGGLAAVGLTSAAEAASAILIQTLIALFLAVSLDPLVRALNRRGLPRPLAVIVILTAFITLLSLFLLSVIPPLVDQVNTFAEDVPTYVENLQEQSERFEDLNEQFEITDRLQEFAATLPANLAGSVMGIILWVFTAVGSTLLVIVLTIYFLLDLPRIRRGVPRLFPMRSRGRFSGIADVVVDKVGAYMIGQFAISLIAGFTAFVALTVVGATAPLPLAIMVAVTAIIPLIGATLGAVISVIVTALTNELWPTAVVLLGFFIVYQQVENYLIAPRVQRSAVDLSAPAVLLAGIVGAAMQGLLGALMAIPLAAAIKVVVMQRIEAHEEEEHERAATPRRERGARLRRRP